MTQMPMMDKMIRIQRKKASRPVSASLMSDPN
jgi:hypothetical protein